MARFCAPTAVSLEGIVSAQIPRLDLGTGAYARVTARELNGSKARSIEPGESWLWCYADRVMAAELKA